MKTIYFILKVVLVTACVFNQKELNAGTGPHIKFEKEIVDFGEVKPLSENVAVFRFFNKGNEQLIISKVASTCSCTVLELKKKNYSPGESGEIKVKFKAPIKGPGGSNINVITNGNKKTILRVKAKVVSKVETVSKSLELSLISKNAGIKPIKLVSKDGKPFSIKSFNSTGDAISADINLAKKATVLEIKPVVNLKKLEGSLCGKITLKLSHPHTSIVEIPYSTPSRYQLIPSSIFLFNADPNKPVLREISLTSNYTDSIQLDSVASAKGQIKVLAFRADDNKAKIALEITPKNGAGKSSYFADFLKMKFENGDEISVPCRGYYATEKNKKINISDQSASSER